MSSQPLIIILGATAAGKTKLAVSIADEIGAEIISGDSRQIFKGMDIGTGKDLSEYHINGKQIPHHLIDIKKAGEKYHVNAFKNDFYEAFADINSRNKMAILCGGTGMYIHSILQNHEFTAIPKNEQLRASISSLGKIELQNFLNQYPEKLRIQVDYSSAKRLIRGIEIADYLNHNEIIKINRPIIKPLIIGLQSDIVKRRDRIIKRLNYRLNNGLIEEVEMLLKQGVEAEILTFYGLEYKFVVAYLQGEITLPILKERLATAICQFAKRQMTFFRKMEKDGVKINWLNAEDDPENLKLAVLALFNASFEPK